MAKIKIIDRKHPAYGMTKKVISVELCNERPWLKVSMFPEGSPIPNDTDNYYMVAPNEYEIVEGPLPDITING